MSKWVVLDSLGEDGFRSCEGFADWSTCSPLHCNEDQGDSSSFGEWSSFHGSLSKDEESAPLPPHERHSSHKHKVEDGDPVSPWFVFHDCFHAEETVKDPAVIEVPPLSQLLHSSAHTETLSGEAASLCRHLLCAPDFLSLSGPKLNLHSQKQLVNTLQLKHSDQNILQNTHFPDLGFEEPESPAALIQTKLMTPTCCRNKPGYLYLISRQWLSQYSLGLLPHQDKQDLLQ